jgi:hypothetical protein
VSRAWAGFNFMDFDEFQNYAPLYVIGALEPAEIKDFEEGLERFGEKAKGLVRHCYALHESFALRVRPRKSLVTLKERVMSRVRIRGS